MAGWRKPWTTRIDRASQSISGHFQTGRKRRHPFGIVFPSHLPAHHRSNDAMQPALKNSWFVFNSSCDPPIFAQRVGQGVEKAENGPVQLSERRRWTDRIEWTFSPWRWNWALGSLRHFACLIAYAFKRAGRVTGQQSRVQQPRRNASADAEPSGLPALGSRGTRQTGNGTRRTNSLEQRVPES